VPMLLIAEEEKSRMMGRGMKTLMGAEAGAAQAGGRAQYSVSMMALMQGHCTTIRVWKIRANTAWKEALLG